MVKNDIKGYYMVCGKNKLSLLYYNTKIKIDRKIDVYKIHRAK